MLRRFGAERRSMILPDFEMWDEPIIGVLSGERWRAEGLNKAGSHNTRGISVYRLYNTYRYSLYVLIRIVYCRTLALAASNR